MLTKKKAIEFPHPGHTGHLCYLVNIRYNESSPAEFKELIRDGQYVCKNCGRVAREKMSLCKPVKL